jgi:type VI secretion system protein ImpA
MPPLPDLLAPIPGPEPAGADLRYDEVYDKLKDARREDDASVEDGAHNVWKRPRKTADWPLVIKLASDVLANRSKDLQIAIWLTEGLLHREGFGGLRSGLGLLGGLLEQYWDGLYPQIEDGDAEARIALLAWVGSRFALPVHQVPLNQRGHDLARYHESRLVGYEHEVKESDDRSRIDAREAALAAGRLAPEEFDKAVGETAKESYPRLVADLAGSLDALERLDRIGDAKFGADAPGYGPLRSALEEALRVAQQLTKMVGLEMQISPAAASNAPRTPETLPPEAQPTRVGNGGIAAPPGSPEEAAARLASAASFLRHADPRNPAPYLALRGFRWGELRQAGRPDPRLLEAPPTPVRARLKGLLLDRQWQQLLEAAEAVMETPQGRGWLDLQRYAVTACEGLGAPFAPVADAIRAELRMLLADMPDLPEMTLMDDTPAANRETQSWLRESVLDNGDPPAAGDGSSGPREPATITARAGSPQRAIQTIIQELEHETSRRGRFLRQTELAGVMVEADLAGVAKPILEELVAQIDAHKLEEWEAGELVARPLALLYRCLDQLGTDAALKEALYLRVCRLDPLQAISFARS